MRKLTTVESRYWIDSFPVDLAIACAVAVCVMILTAPLVFHFTMRYFANHRVLEPQEHRSASIFLAVKLAVFTRAPSAPLTIAGPLFARMYRDPL